MSESGFDEKEGWRKRGADQPAAEQGSQRKCLRRKSSSPGDSPHRSLGSQCWNTEEAEDVCVSVCVGGGHTGAWGAGGQGGG